MAPPPPPPPPPHLRMDRVTIREKEELEKREEQLETERKRQDELRKRESQRVSLAHEGWFIGEFGTLGRVIGGVWNPVLDHFIIKGIWNLRQGISGIWNPTVGHWEKLEP